MKRIDTIVELGLMMMSIVVGMQFGIWQQSFSAGCFLVTLNFFILTLSIRHLRAIDRNE
jgi:uncharacterized membrane protein YhaH (DUF805 family)